MSKKIGLIILVVLALSLGACQRAASTAPQAVALATDYPQPLATDGMNVVEQAGTLTAIAQSGGVPPATDSTPVAPGENTPEGGVVITPVAAADTPLPSPTPAVVAPQATIVTARPGTYALKEGEFPFCIARRFNVDPGELLSLNGLSNFQTFYAGQTLKIPSTGHPFPEGRALKAHPTTYTVRAGDTIYSIACSVYGDVDPLNIAATNGLTAPYTLTAGAQINIP